MYEPRRGAGGGVDTARDVVFCIVKVYDFESAGIRSCSYSYGSWSDEEWIIVDIKVHVEK